MANDITSRPWNIDTVGTVYTHRTYIHELVWSEQVAAGDHLTITDINGKILVDTRADSPNDYQRFGKLGWVNGIVLTVLDSGTLLLYP